MQEAKKITSVPFNPRLLKEIEDWESSNIVEKHQKPYWQEQNIKNHLCQLQLSFSFKCCVGGWCDGGSVCLILTLSMSHIIKYLELYKIKY